MPIRPEMKARYPKNWPEIRARILKRAGNQCERCGVPNGVYRYHDPMRGCDSWVRELEGLIGSAKDAKVARVVLTIAHVHDPDPANCADENLQALCQRCHNRLDMPMRQRNAAKTRKAGKAHGDLFEAPA